MKPEASTAGPTLARLEAADLDLYLRLHGDPEVMRHIGSPASVPTAEADFRAALALPPGPLGQGRQRRVPGLADGQRIGLLGVDAQQDPIELGLMLLPAWQRQGLGRRIVAAALAELVRHAAGRVVQVQYERSNHAMAAVARALGFDPPEADASSIRVKQRLLLDAAAESFWSP